MKNLAKDGEYFRVFALVAPIEASGWGRGRVMSLVMNGMTRHQAAALRPG